jgi:peptidyl-tRNA hydrolase, PTH1 family
VKRRKVKKRKARKRKKRAPNEKRKKNNSFSSRLPEKITHQTSSTHSIVGLGNPGRRYDKTRHNVGFMVLDELVERLEGKFKLETSNYLLARVFILSTPIFLIKPATYMNNSGQAVRQFIQYYKVDDYSNFLIVSDDVNLPFGSIRIREGGSSGGQKGLESIIAALKTEDFPRLRIGIGDEFEDAVSHVLSQFNRSEKKVLPDIIRYAADAAECFFEYGIQKAMNEYNRNILT